MPKPRSNILSSDVIKKKKKEEATSTNKFDPNHHETAKEATVILPFHLQIALAQQPEVYSPPCNAGPITKIEMARAMFK